MEDDFGYQCDLFEVEIEAGWTVHLDANQGYLIPVTTGVTFFVGNGHKVGQARPWMDTYTYPWAVYSPDKRTVQFMRIQASGR